eukprot:scaffold33073_cov76-Amphora_coffeaeformis.AAC.1
MADRTTHTFHGGGKGGMATHFCVVHGSEGNEHERQSHSQLRFVVVVGIHSVSGRQVVSERHTDLFEIIRP